MPANVVISVNTARLDRLLAGLPVRTDTVIGKVAHDAVAKMAEHMDEPKSGLVYGAHQASAPGEAPAVDTGALKSSLYAKRIRNAVWEVGAGMEYAPHLEFGTTRMAARPYFVRSLLEVGKTILKEIKVIFT